MPTQSGPLSPDDARERTVAWILKQGAGHMTCTLCKRDEFTVTEPLALAEVGPDGVNTTERGMKFIPVVCDHCGNTLLISAHVAGL
ncbi:hypothetical protein SAMN05660748_1230 [Blastococcus aggregatus]|uniref:Uncharacterized protein n=2 Tax=Blastococcus aggregatus TaxID=38502 RepID=A0A285V319_9ACTN|nr:hypothetical protein SAMN05660748_1230 [Blastococcus aggregatus]